MNAVEAIFLEPFTAQEIEAARVEYEALRARAAGTVVNPPLTPWSMLGPDVKRARVSDLIERGGR